MIDCDKLMEREDSRKVVNREKEVKQERTRRKEN